MKCSNCGYEQGWSWQKDENNKDNFVNVNPLGKEFIKITALTEGDFGEKYQIYLYGCPKCRVVQLMD